MAFGVGLFVRARRSLDARRKESSDLVTLLGWRCESGKGMGQDKRHLRGRFLIGARQIYARNLARLRA